MNEKYSKEEYEEKIKNLELNKYSKFHNGRDYFLNWVKTLPHRLNRNFKCEDCTGNYLINSQRCHECFNSYELQDCAYCTWIFNSHDCMDVYGMGYSEWILECLGNEKVNTCAFNTFVSHSSDTYYSDICFNSRYLFGCVGLRNKNYCIFNKEYSAEEYEKLKGQIIEHMKKTGEWGRFFPLGLSPFAYNETAAVDYFPLNKEEVLAAGYKWKDPSPKDYLAQSYEIPDDLNDVDAGLCDQTLACVDCGKNFKIMPNELRFYKKMNLPIPRKCLDCRYKDRLKVRNPREMWDRKCDKCGLDIETTYAPKREEKIYCEKCYKETVS
jgi:hypothetical protein